MVAGAGTTPATTPAMGIVGMPAGRGGRGGGGLPAEDVVAVVALAAYWRGPLLYDMEIFVCGGNRQGHTSSHTLVMLDVSRHTFGGDGICPQNLWLEFLSNKNAWQLKLVIFYTKVLGTKNEPKPL